MRGEDRTVRRDSYDVDDKRANVWRPIGDGTVAGAMDFRDALIQTAREYDDHHRGDRGVRPLGWTAIRVLEILLGVRGCQFASRPADWSRRSTPSPASPDCRARRSSKRWHA
ncbi:hypothetical protein P0F65_13380 [Sphingomonas sp. I4]